MKERLNRLIKIKGLTASSLADELSVQRSGISHILNGRNKPSLDLLQKILEHFPDISPDWLILGLGEPQRAHENHTGQHDSGEKIFPEGAEKPSGNKEGAEKAPVKNISKVIVFYSDNTFEVYHQRD
jgi:transcriptional regulator with XRE-family HTH domain